MNPVFATDEFVVHEATRADVSELQALVEANPEYWLLTRGQLPPADFAAQCFEHYPPADMTYSANLILLVRDARISKLIGQLDVATDLMIRGVYHLGYFMIATQAYGTGLGYRLYKAYERWTLQREARWLRLGVFEANTRAEAFWRRLGYLELKRQDNYRFGNLSHTLITMLKPLSGATVDEYLEAVPRDRPS